MSRFHSAGIHPNTSSASQGRSIPRTSPSGYSMFLPQDQFNYWKRLKKLLVFLIYPFSIISLYTGVRN
uniref:Uncharacterized protein n=1 Tax=Oryza rufipogon TaxID=4529 RepID=A0A0E0RA24_ORYRU